MLVVMSSRFFSLTEALFSDKLSLQVRNLQKIQVSEVSALKYIERPEYMQRLLDLMGTPDIKIITGVRRSGKSELMKAYIRKIIETQPDANIIYVDLY